MSTIFVPTIGLEVHAEIKTASKMFCGCPNDPDEERVNMNVCPICLAHPGTLPVLNREAIRQVLRVGLALQGKVADFTEWDRKNYFYPDIPKGYQISQYKFPLISGGTLHGVEIERIHLEEDTAQSTHDTHEKSLINFNRAGVPLMELVTKPVIHDAETAVAFAKELQLLLRYLGAGEANLEKGEMRIEANISVASPEDTAAGRYGTKTEVKNLNSFRVVEKSIAFEISRQSEILNGGGKVVQETRGYDDRAGETYSQRAKESSHDYRYFPDPDIPKMRLSEMEELSEKTLRDTLPELPADKRVRYKKDFAVTDKEAAVFISSPVLATYFESVISIFSNDLKKIRLTINYLLNNYLSKINVKSVTASTETPTSKDSATSKPAADSLENNLNKISPEAFAELIALLDEKAISSTGASTLIDLALKSAGGFNSSFKDLAQKENLVQNNNNVDLEPVIMKIVTDNANVVDEYKKGKVASLQYLIGQVMKVTKGSANPEMIRNMLIEKLGARP